MKTLPPDPDGQNYDRANWAAASLTTMMKETGCGADEALGDLLCNLRHWCDRHGQDFDAVNYFAAQTYEEETKVSSELSSINMITRIGNYLCELDEADGSTSCQVSITTSDGLYSSSLALLMEQGALDAAGAGCERTQYSVREETIEEIEKWAVSHGY